MRKIIEHEATHRDLLDVEHPRGFKQMLQGSVIGMEGQRDESLEAAGFILQRAQSEQVIDAVFVILDVAVEHGCVGFQSYLMSQSGGVEPLIAIDFVVADDVSNPVGKYFSPTPRQRIHP